MCGNWAPARHRKKVDFPQPEGPKMLVNEPESRVKLISFRIFFPKNSIDILSVTICGLGKMVSAAMIDHSRDTRKNSLKMQVFPRVIN